MVWIKRMSIFLSRDGTAEDSLPPVIIITIAYSIILSSTPPPPSDSSPMLALYFRQCTPRMAVASTHRASKCTQASNKLQIDDRSSSWGTRLDVRRVSHTIEKPRPRSGRSGRPEGTDGVAPKRQQPPAPKAWKKKTRHNSSVPPDVQGSKNGPQHQKAFTQIGLS